MSSVTEGLQIAQIIADLQALQNAVRPPSSSSSSSPPPTLSPSSTNTSLPCHSTPSPAFPPPSRFSAFISLFIPPPQSYSPPAEVDSSPRTQDPNAALALLTPLKSPVSTSTSMTSPTSRRSSAPKFEKLGRKLVSASRSQSNAGIKTPPFTREGSAASMSSLIMSGASTPTSNTCSNSHQDADLQRASTLLQLCEMRGKFRQMGDTGLSRAKQRVDEVVARYAKEELEEREKVAGARHLGV